MTTDGFAWVGEVGTGVEGRDEYLEWAGEDDSEESRSGIEDE